MAIFAVCALVVSIVVAQSGVPLEVTDLNVALEPWHQVYLPLTTK